MRDANTYRFIKSGLHLMMVLLLVFSFKNLRAQEAQQKKFNVAIQTGYFSEKFRWSIAGDSKGENPNIYSELRWKNLSGPQLAINAQYNFWKSFLLRIDFSESFITSGTVTDTDFGKDNRTDTLYHDSFNSNKGSVIAYNISLGYKIKIKQCSVTPFAGYVSNMQSLYLLRDYGNVVGNLHSTYTTKWQGFTAGFNVQIPLVKKIVAEPQFIYNQTNYSSKANWNLIENFKHPVSFRHSAIGFGIESSIKVRYMIKQKLSVFLGSSISYWTTGKGSDRLYLSNGQIPTTQFNGAVRNGYNIFLGASLPF